MDKDRFLRKDYMLHKPKYFLYCNHCNLAPKEINILIRKNDENRI